MTVLKQRVSPDAFRRAFRYHAAGVAVITADVGDGPVAMTVSSVASVTVDPPTLVFSASAISSSTPTIRRAETVVVHLLASDQVELARLGAKSGAARFGDDIEWARLPTGEPYYPKANSWIRGRVVELVGVYGSVLVVVEALEAKPDEDQYSADVQPLVYHNRKWFALSEHEALPDSRP